MVSGGWWAALPMLTYQEIVIRLVLAALLGSIVGLDRQRLNWAAGLRTHMLVCVGATLFMLVSSFGFMESLALGHVTLDPSRVAAQVVSGIGFLGAGSILVRGKMVHGINTAAGLWTVAAVGLAVGGGLYVAAVCATGMIILILAGLKPLENRFFSQQNARKISLKLHRHHGTLGAIEAAVAETHGELMHLTIQPSKSADEDTVWLTFRQPLRQDRLLALLDQLRRVKGVRKVSHGVKPV